MQMMSYKQEFILGVQGIFKEDFVVCATSEVGLGSYFKICLRSASTIMLTYVMD